MPRAMDRLANDLRRARLLVRAAGNGAAVRFLLASRAYRIARDSMPVLQRRVGFGGDHTFTDRSRGADQLVMVVAGHKPHLWPHTLPRLERFAGPELDVCLVCPGVRPPELEALAERAGWSFLATAENALALAQNLAVAHHPRARWLHKVDEDVVIGERHFERMLDGYRRVLADGRFLPGFCAPLLNVNGFSYRLFLEALGLEDAYEARFGELRQAAEGIRAHHDGEAARWLWGHSVPFDAVAERIAAASAGYSAVPHRFSIGAILLERDLWEEIGGFLVVPRGGLGHEEEHLCKECLGRSRPAIVLHDVLAGHFSFGPQDDVMRPALRELEPGLAMAGTPAAA